MNALAITLRLVHILGGVYWAGTMFFMVTFLEPTLRSMGPEGGKVMGGLAARGFMKVLPIVSLLTLLSGLWLLWILSGGFDSSYMGSKLGMALSTGGGFAIIAWVLGLTIIRPATMRMAQIGGSMAQADEASRNALSGEVNQLRRRVGTWSKVVFALLVGAVALMAVARYLT
jgi:hypothetical protein